MRFDHVIVLVEDVEDWSARFTKAGFTVVPRADRDGETPEHRLVCFADAGYIELIHVEPGDSHAPPWVELMSPLGDGYGAYSLNVADMETSFPLLPGSSGRAPARGGNHVTGVGPWAVRVGAVDEALTVPFLIEDVEGGDVRVPSGPAREHRNGATGLAGVSLVVPDLAGIAAALGPLLGECVPVPAVDWSDGEGVVFRFGGQWLAAHVPRESTWAHRYLGHRGPGPCEITIALASAADPGHGGLLAEVEPVRVRVA